MISVLSLGSRKWGGCLQSSCGHLHQYTVCCHQTDLNSYPDLLGAVIWNKVLILGANFTLQKNGGKMPSLPPCCENRIKQSIYVKPLTLCWTDSRHQSTQAHSFLSRRTWTSTREKVLYKCSVSLVTKIKWFTCSEWVTVLTIYSGSHAVIIYWVPGSKCLHMGWHL